MSQSRSGNSETTRERAVRQHHTVFADRRRRIVLAVLEGMDQPIDIDTLARRVADREQAVDDASVEQVEQVQLSLYHCHLPLLSEFDLVNYEQAAETISITDYGGDRLRTELQFDDERAAGSSETAVGDRY